MDLMAQVDKAERRQYLTQANIVYLSSFFSYFILIPLFFIAGDPLVACISLVPMLAGPTAYFLNKKGLHGLASIVFITPVTMVAFTAAMRFGMEPGFIFYFFNLSVLIIYTTWIKLYKILAVIVETLLCVIAFGYYHFVGPVISMAEPQLIIFFMINLFLNIIGVVNSSSYYFRVAKRAQRDLQKFATTDFLTSLPNRAALQNYLKNLKPNKLGIAPEYSIFMLDIDYFKFINDKYGHPVGDNVLVHVGELLKSMVGPKDFLGRLGGEEFVIIHFESDEKKVYYFAESIRKAVEQKLLEVDNYHVRFTVSIGALFRKRNIVSFEEAMKLADALLYDAKEKGRNCVKMKTI